MRKNLQILFVLSVLFCAVGCGGANATASTEAQATLPATPPPNVWDADLTAAFPSDTVLLVHADADAIRTWHAWPTVLTLLDSMHRQNPSFGDAQWETLTRRTHELAFGVTMNEQANESHALAIGRVDTANVVLGETPVVDRFGFRTTVNTADDYAAAVLDPRTAILVDPEYFDGELQRLKSGDFPAIWTNPAMLSLRDSVHADGAALTVLFRPPGIFRLVLLALATGELRFDQATATALSNTEAISARVDVGSDLHASVFIDSDTPASATLVAAGLQSLIRGYASNLALMLAGVTPILNRVAIGATDSRVTISVTITAAEADAMLARANLLLVHN